MLNTEFNYLSLVLRLLDSNIIKHKIINHSYIYMCVQDQNHKIKPKNRLLNLLTIQYPHPMHMKTAGDGDDDDDGRPSASASASASSDLPPASRRRRKGHSRRPWATAGRWPATPSRSATPDLLPTGSAPSCRPPAPRRLPESSSAP